MFKIKRNSAEDIMWNKSFKHKKQNMKFNDYSNYDDEYDRYDDYDEYID